MATDHAAIVREALECAMCGGGEAEQGAALAALDALVAEERRWYEHFHTEMQRADAAEAALVEARRFLFSSAPEFERVMAERDALAAALREIADIPDPTMAYVDYDHSNPRTVQDIVFAARAALAAVSPSTQGNL